MDIVIVEEKSLRIKGKQVYIGVDVEEQNQKLPIDVDILLTLPSSQALSQEEGMIVITGAGDYEIKGTKIEGTRTDGGVYYTTTIDGVLLSVVTASTVAAKGKDLFTDMHMALICCDSVLPQATLSTISAQIIVLYGEHAKENIAVFGKDAETVSKLTVSREKIPTEMQLVLLTMS